MPHEMHRLFISPAARAGWSFAGEWTWVSGAQRGQVTRAGLPDEGRSGGGPRIAIEEGCE